MVLPIVTVGWIGSLARPHAAPTRAPRRSLLRANVAALVARLTGRARSPRHSRGVNPRRARGAGPPGARRGAAQPPPIIMVPRICMGWASTRIWTAANSSANSAIGHIASTPRRPKSRTPMRTAVAIANAA